MEEITIKVKSLGGGGQQELSITVPKDISVQDLKTKLEGETNVKAEQQKLIFLGKVLKNEQSITEFSIKNGSTIHLVATPVQANPPPPESQPSPQAQPIPQAIPQPQAGNSNVMMFVVPEGGGTDLNQILNGVLNSIGLNPQNIAGVQATTSVRVVQNPNPIPSPIPNFTPPNLNVNNNNANNAPNNLNLDNLPEDMKRILQNDKEFQSKKENIHQRPFSNAYLQSFPPAKKVKVASQSELKNPNLVLQSRLRDAFKSSSVLDQQPDDIIKDLIQDEQLLKLFKEQLIKDLKQRVQSDPDYEETKFPNIANLSNF